MTYVYVSQGCWLHAWTVTASPHSAASASTGTSLSSPRFVLFRFFIIIIRCHDSLTALAAINVNRSAQLVIYIGTYFECRTHEIDACYTYKRHICMLHMHCRTIMCCQQAGKQNNRHSVPCKHRVGSCGARRGNAPTFRFVSGSRHRRLRICSPPPQFALHRFQRSSSGRYDFAGDVPVVAVVIVGALTVGWPSVPVLRSVDVPVAKAVRQQR